MKTCTLKEDLNKADGDNAEIVITTSPNFQNADTAKVQLVYTSGNDWTLKIHTNNPLGWEIKGLYIECIATKSGANIAGDTGYAASSYGIADVSNSNKRYMGPLHIK